MNRRFWRIFLTATVAVLCALCGWACSSEGSANSSGTGINTEKYENFYGSYKTAYVFPYGGEMIVSLYQDGSYQIYEMYINTNDGYYRQATETGTYTKGEGFVSDTLTVGWIFAFHATNTNGIQNGEYFNLNMGFYTENLWKDRIFFYGQKEGDGPTLYMSIGESGYYKLDYVPVQYSLTYAAGEGGSITGDTEQVVEKGEDGYEVTAVADYGYEFVGWSDGVKTAKRQDNNVQSSISVVAEFELVLPVYTVRYTCTEGGGFVVDMYDRGDDWFVSTDPTPVEQRLIEGLDGEEVAVYPNNGYEFIGWSDGVTEMVRQEKDVRENIEVQAIFKPVYTYTAEVGLSGGLGKVVVSDMARYANDYTVQATAVPEEGWAFYGWSDGVKTATRTDTLTEDFYVEAIFGKVFTLIALDGGTLSYEGQSGKKIEVVVISDQYPAPYVTAIADEGYDCMGWFEATDADSWRVSYSDGVRLDFYSTRTTYYAIFKKEE